MKNSMASRLAAVLLLAVPNALHACAVCYGQSDAPMAHGMNWGIMSLLAIIGTVLGGVVAFFVYVGHRSATHPIEPGPESSPEDR